jgi:hypothetical protein
MLALRYRILIHPGRPDTAKLEAEAQNFSQTHG